MSRAASSSSEYVRRGLLKIDSTTVFELVDALDLRGSAKVSPVIGIPLRNLQQRRDLDSFVLSAPLAAAKALLELLAAESLEQVIAALGEHADTPTYEQLRAAVDEVVAAGASDDDIVALLTFAIGEEFPAAIHCRQLLEERPALKLPQLPSAPAPSSLLSPKAVDPLVREQRRARREERAKKSKAPSSSRPPAKRVKKSPGTEASIAPPPPSTAPAALRRRVALTPAEAAAFDNSHVLVGTVFLADIPFGAVDSAQSDARSKERPALIVAAAERQVLVRGLYSQPSNSRILFGAWRRIGLDHVSYIDDERWVVVVANVERIEQLGRLTVDEWNSLV